MLGSFRLLAHQLGLRKRGYVEMEFLISRFDFQTKTMRRLLIDVVKHCFESVKNHDARNAHTHTHTTKKSRTDKLYSMVLMSSVTSELEQFKRQDNRFDSR